MDKSVLELKSVIQSRIFLRAARQRIALQIPYAPEKEVACRLNLLPVLSYALDSREQEDLQWTPEEASFLIDCATSVALAPPASEPEQELSALSVSVQLLCSQEQFARLRAISPRLSDLALRWDNERPFLAVCLRALSSLFKRNQNENANSLLLRALGMQGEAPPKRAKRDQQNGCDFLLANGLRLWINSHYSSEGVGGDTSALEKVRSLAAQAGLASTFELSAVALDYAHAINRCATAKVLTQSEKVFASPGLFYYLKDNKQRTLFPSQRQAIEKGVLTEQNVLLTLPTSGGKTFLAELRIITELQKNPGSKVIYLAPYKTLANQVEASLREGLRSAKLSIRDYGGDVDLGKAQEFVRGEVSDVAVMTPEKFDALLRLSDSSLPSAGEVKKFLASVKLFVWDELQVIGRAGRGPRLELLIARIKQKFPSVPLMALSGVISGEDKVSQWLGDAVIFGSEQRPTGILEAVWQHDGELRGRRPNGKSYHLGNIAHKAKPVQDTADLVAQLEMSKSHLPVLVMESRISYAVSALKAIHEHTPHRGEEWRAGLKSNQRQLLIEAAEEVEALTGDMLLADCIRSGLAIHHSRLPATILRGIENLASVDALRVIVSTSTVAEGAHLPFRVVVIPHLNFQGSISGRLEKDLYDNIVGRAGRAGVAAEALIFILESDKMRGHVENALWKEARMPLCSALPQVSFFPASGKKFEELQQVKSQILAWLGDDESYVEDQSLNLASRTLSSFTSNSSSFSNLCVHTFQELENQDFAVAASPYRLTAAGKRARLAGLSPSSCLRLMAYLDDSNAVSWESHFYGALALSEEQCDLIARAVFRTDEAISRSLWIDSQGNQDSQFEVLRQLSKDEMEWPTEDEIWQFDVQVLAQWIHGRTLSEIASLTVPQGVKNLDSSNLSDDKRVTLLREHIDKLLQSAGWSWSGACALTQSQGEKIPSWIHLGIEYGVPNQTASYLCSELKLSRSASLKISPDLPIEWSYAREAILEWNDQEINDFDVTRSDKVRISAWRDENVISW